MQVVVGYGCAREALDRVLDHLDMPSVALAEPMVQPCNADWSCDLNPQEVKHTLAPLLAPLLLLLAHVWCGVLSGFSLRGTGSNADCCSTIDTTSQLVWGHQTNQIVWVQER